MLPRLLFSLSLLALPLSPAFAEGGSDNSGGSVVRATRAQVDEALANAKQETQNALRRLALTLNEESKENFDREHGEGSFNLLTKSLFPGGNVSSLENLRNGSIAIVPQDAPCPSKEGHDDASAEGSDGTGKICVSRERLLTYPAASLRREVTALFLHEVAHLNKQDEATARAVQNFANANAALVIPEKSALGSLERSAEDLLDQLPRLNLALGADLSDRRLCMEVVRTEQILNDLLRRHGEIDHGVIRAELPPFIYRDLAFAGFGPIKKMSDACAGDGELDRPALVEQIENFELLAAEAIAGLSSFAVDGQRLGKLPMGTAIAMLRLEDHPVYRKAKDLPPLKPFPSSNETPLFCGREWFKKTPAGKIESEGSFLRSAVSKFYGSDAGTLYHETLSQKDGTDVAVSRVAGQDSFNLMVMSKDNGEDTYITSNQREVAPGRSFLSDGIVSVDSDKTTYLPVAHLAPDVRTNVTFFIPKPGNRYLGIRCNLGAMDNLRPTLPKEMRVADGPTPEKTLERVADVAVDIATLLNDKKALSAFEQKCLSEGR